jgi:hypothetical protein
MLTAEKRAELEEQGPQNIRFKLASYGGGRGAASGGFRCGDITRSEIEDWLAEKYQMEAPSGGQSFAGHELRAGLELSARYLQQSESGWLAVAFNGPHIAFHPALSRRPLSKFGTGRRHLPATLWECATTAVERGGWCVWGAYHDPSCYRHPAVFLPLRGCHWDRDRCRKPAHLGGHRIINTKPACPARLGVIAITARADGLRHSGRNSEGLSHEGYRGFDSYVRYHCERHNVSGSS